MSITALISIGESVVPSVPTEAIVNYEGRDSILFQLKIKKKAQIKIQQQFMKGYR